MNRKEGALTALSSGVPDLVPRGDNAIDYDTVERTLGHETCVRARTRCRKLHGSHRGFT